MSDEEQVAKADGPEPNARERLQAALISRDLQQRLVFYGLWGALAMAIVVVFREVLLPFFLAVVVAYVMAPLVDRLQRKMQRWVAVVTIYGLLVGSMAAFGVLGVPRLAGEIEKLAREAPRALAEARDTWLPQLERSMRASMGQPPAPNPEDGEEGEEGSESADSGARENRVRGQGDDSVPIPGGERAEAGPGGLTASGSTAADRRASAGSTRDDRDDAIHASLERGSDEAISIRPVAGGGYDVVLPPEGLLVSPEGDRYRIQAAHHEAKQGDLAAALVDSLRGLARNTQDTATTLLNTAQTVVRTVVKGVFTFFIMLMLSAYLLVTKDEVIGFFRNFSRPEKQPSFDRLLARIDRGLSGVVRGQLLICLINGVLSGIGFYLLDIPYWPILTLIATLFSIIPIFGAILSSVPAVVLGLQHGVGTSALVVVWVVVIHQIEANLLNPKIMGDAAHVHPVLVVFALLGGEHLFGIAGALLAVPVLSIMQSLFLHYREQVLGVPAPRRADASVPS